MVNKKEPKKRGRKPKKKYIKKEPKKRGRKPTSKLIDLNKNNLKDLNKEDECLIVHFPLTINKINKYNDKNNINLININTPKSKINSEISFNDNDNENNLFKDKYIISLEEKIKKLEEDINNEKDKNKNIKNYDIIKCNYDIIHSNDNIKTNNIACWWCCHSFKTQSFYLPDNYINEMFHVFGIFCSPNCAMSYNINLTDSKTWKRNSWIYKLYSFIEKDIQIFPALPKEILKKFGGNLSINEFREKNLSIISSRHIKLPLIPIKSLLELSYKERNTYDHNNKNLNNNRYNKLLNNLNIKKSNKPKNSLEKIMGLKKLKI